MKRIADKLYPAMARRVASIHNTRFHHNYPAAVVSPDGRNTGYYKITCDRCKKYRHYVTWRRGGEAGRSHRPRSFERARVLRDKLIARYAGQGILFGTLAVEEGERE